jgi:pyrroloquinoline quinone biosynthesis protein D
MPPLESVPRLAAGCRVSMTGEQPMLLMPEGALRLIGTSLKIVELCDGQRTLAEIITQLQQQFPAVDPAKIATETVTFLERLHEKRVLNFA